MAASKALAPVKKAQARPPAKRVSTGDVVEEAAITIYDIPSSELVVQALNDHTKLFFDGDTSGDSFLASVIDGAQSADDLFAESELDAVENHLGETLTIQSVDGVRNSDFEGGLGVYLIVTATTLDGELLRLAVGQGDPLAKIVKLHELDALPYPVAFERSEKPTKRGFYPINLLGRKTKSGGTF
jgi:hypothetical protein